MCLPVCRRSESGAMSPSVLTDQNGVKGVGVV